MPSTATATKKVSTKRAATKKATPKKRATAKKSTTTKTTTKKVAAKKPTKTKRTSPTTKKTATPKKVLELVKQAEAQQVEEKRSAKNTKKSVSSKKQPAKTTTTKAKTTKGVQSKTIRKPNVVPIKQRVREQFVPDIRPAINFASTETEGQISITELRKLPVTKREELWKKLNKAESTVFYPILTKEERSLLYVVRFDNAINQDLIAPKKPTKTALYCPYCVSWSRFRKSTYTGYNKCCGCGISTEDYYVKLDNGLFKLRKK